MQLKFLLSTLFIALGFSNASYALSSEKNNEKLEATENSATLLTAKNTTAEQQVAESVLKNILLPQIENTLAAIKELQQDIQKTPQKSKLLHAYQRLIFSWKAVESSYILGDLDFQSIDLPRLIDNYHQGNEDLAKQLQRALKSGDEPRIALFKNSYRSINALDFILFAGEENLTPVQQQYALYILQNIKTKVLRMQKAYQANVVKLNKDQDLAMSFVLNALIDSSYKTKEWRVGEPAGLTRKYEGKPDYQRQEFLYSRQSLTAVAAVLHNLEAFLGEQSFKNLASYSIQLQAGNSIQVLRKTIKQAQQELANLQAKPNAYKFKPSEIQPLYEQLSIITDLLYISLVKGLPVQAKILDADGD